MAARARPYPLKHFLARLLWQMQIDDYEVGTEMDSGIDFFNEVYGSLAVIDDSEFTPDPVLLKRFTNQNDVPDIIFYEDNLPGRSGLLRLIVLLLPGW